VATCVGSGGTTGFRVSRSNTRIIVTEGSPIVTLETLGKDGPASNFSLIWQKIDSAAIGGSQKIEQQHPAEQTGDS